jgi:hypothetical protein
VSQPPSTGLPALSPKPLAGLSGSRVSGMVTQTRVPTFYSVVALACTTPVLVRRASSVSQAAAWSDGCAEAGYANMRASHFFAATLSNVCVSDSLLRSTHSITGGCRRFCKNRLRLWASRHDERSLPSGL